MIRLFGVQVEGRRSTAFSMICLSSLSLLHTEAGSDPCLLSANPPATATAKPYKCLVLSSRHLISYLEHHLLRGFAGQRVCNKALCGHDGEDTFEAQDLGP